MINKKKILIYLALLTQFNNIIPSALKELTQCVLGASLLSGPIYYLGYKNEKKSKEALKIKDDEIYNFLIDFFSIRIDGFLYIHEINKNKNDTEKIREYLTIVSNRYKEYARSDYTISKLLFVLIFSTLFTTCTTSV